MTRIFNMGSPCQRQGGFEIDTAIVQRASHDGARDAVAFMRFERGDIVDGGHAARGDHRRLERARQGRRRRDIDAGKGAVAIDIGENDRRRAGIEQSSTHGGQFALSCQRITEGVSWVQRHRFGKAT